MFCSHHNKNKQQVEEEDDDDDDDSDGNDEDEVGECIFPHLTQARECEDVGLKYLSCDRLTNEQCADYNV